MRQLFQVNSLGSGPSLFEWNKNGTCLAAVGSKRKVGIFDRNGRLYSEVHLPAAEFLEGESPEAAQLQWDPDGEQLAIIPNGNTAVLVWSVVNKEVKKIDTDFKTQVFTAMAWSRTGKYLAMGTAKGNLLIYNCHERKKTPYVGKHVSKIVCMVWTKDDMLAMAGMDLMVSITSAATGETVKGFSLKQAPTEIHIANVKGDGKTAKEFDSSFSINQSGKSVLVLEFNNGGTEEKVLDIVLHEAWGAIEKHLWFGDGYILVAFRSGRVVAVSTLKHEIHEEVYGEKLLEVCTTIACSPAYGRIAVGGSNSVRILETSGPTFAENKTDAIDLQPDQIVQQVGWTQDGQVLTVSLTNGLVLSFLSTLPVVFDYQSSKVIYLTSLQEMTLVDMSNREVSPTKIEIESEPSFCGLGPNHAAVGMNNQVWFYRITGRDAGRLVNKREYLGSVSVIKLSATHAAVLIEDKVLVHPIEVGPGAAVDDFDKLLPPPGQVQTLTCLMPSGARMVFEDDQGNINLFNPVNDQVLPVPCDLTGRADNIMWDVQDPHVFVIAEQQALHVMLYVPVSISGPRVELLGKQSIHNTHSPLMVIGGSVQCRLKNGALDAVILDTHRNVQSNDAVAKNAPGKRFSQCLKLCRLKAAWESAALLRNNDAWRQLGVVALEMLDVEMAIAAYRMQGDASMVLSLERVKHYEDKNLLAGHIIVLLDKDQNQAQELFLRSSQPKAALEMRKDLKHWSKALKLAEKLDPDNIAHISKEHAATLEMIGEYAQASNHYHQALESLAVQTTPIPDAQALSDSCKAGIARCLMQRGDLRQGRSIALQLKSQQLFKECAHILEGLSQYGDAAEMYERAGQYERAASIYIQTKNFAAATPLMARISSSKLQLQFAKAKEQEGKFSEAAAAFEAAGDMDAVVRLALGPLHMPQRAYAVVRKTRSTDAAWNLAEYCLRPTTKDYEGAVEFLLVAGKMEQAFDVAQNKGAMDTFARILMSTTQPADYGRIAYYYENRGEYVKAGDMWCAAEEYPRAVQLYLKINDDAVLDKAIRIVEFTHNRQLGVQIMDYVNAEKEGQIRDEYNFKLNVAMGQFLDAATYALELARFEQSLVAINDHTTAARMLVRVARNISKFPKHIVPILTSTIIECNRAGLKKTAFEYAAMLMRQEYSMPGPETELQCFNCQNEIPVDVATGKRVLLEDWGECPCCHFACTRQQFMRILQAESRCPMCNEEVPVESVQRLSDPLAKLKAQQDKYEAALADGTPGIEMGEQPRFSGVDLAKMTSGNEGGSIWGSSPQLSPQKPAMIEVRGGTGTASKGGLQVPGFAGMGRTPGMGGMSVVSAVSKMDMASKRGSESNGVASPMPPQSPLPPSNFGAPVSGRRRVEVP
ncbi:hypothetical protein DUNSADRAFT_14848 [Dunaliella salina]|uniref:Anaphase-promoting complex subunit 4 WD40 domain-containing protein n=1 Tax=Dunaliella salina TaxID=3046 RepID=A0ABQ7H2A6_DUNSA|nr:hypothetical protein DUNSADRAFT_14848 [Dunaliella salina]KAF5840992.1 hypothetical protein DUNSADRAFT_14848 [Dunaliella salina]|eukprot:KAF5840991.1 hypothetical protein DUNSADRAFT_14848 [Dunaliella salina]